MSESLALSITLPEIPEASDIESLISLIYPHLSLSNTRLERLPNSITNVIFAIFNDSDGFKPLIIKIFGSNTDNFIDRQAELNTMLVLSKYKLAPRIVLRFTNGIIYHFVQGTACSIDEAKDPSISSLIARQMAKLHSVPLEAMSRTPCLVPLMRRFLRLIEESSHRPTDYAVLSCDIDWIENEVLPQLVPCPHYGIDIVLCHNDLISQNILYHASTHSVSFIDFEYSGINYALFDVANHFTEYAGADQIDFDRYPTRNEQCRWLNTYFEMRGLMVDDLDKICDMIEKFSILSHLCYGLWALVQITFSKSNYDYEGYARRRLNRFNELKSVLRSV